MVKCLACGSNKIATLNDHERNLQILKCIKCGEMYAISDKDIHALGEDFVVAEWRKNYESQKRIGS